MRPGSAIVALWVGWAVSWLLAAFWSAPTERRPSFGDELQYRLPWAAGTLLMAVPAHGDHSALRFWHVGWTAAWLCVSGVALGLAFAWWARIYLGRLWSASITLKAEHRIVDSGPYRFVRHPIYTGLSFSLLATAAIKGTLWGLLGLVILLFGVWLKARQEEAWLSRALGAEAYGAYRKRVPMLVPFSPL